MHVIPLLKIVHRDALHLPTELELGGPEVRPYS